MKRLRLFERRLNLQFADLITGTVGGSVGSGWVGSFLSFLLLSLKPPPQFCRFFYWFALRRQSFFCHHSHLFFCKHQAWQRKPVQICGGGKKSLIFFIAMKYFFSQNLARIFVWWFFLGHQPWSDLGTMHAFTIYWYLHLSKWFTPAASLYSLSSCRWCSPLSGKWLGPGPRVAVTE